MKWLKALVSPSEIIDAAKATGDALVFTPEERAHFLAQYVTATMPMNIARRLIALLISALWGVFTIVAAVLLFVDADLFALWSAFMNDTVNEPMSIIMAFYFLAHVLKGVKK